MLTGEPGPGGPGNEGVEASEANKNLAKSVRDKIARIKALESAVESSGKNDDELFGAQGNNKRAFEMREDWARNEIRDSINPILEKLDQGNLLGYADQHDLGAYDLKLGEYQMMLENLCAKHSISASAEQPAPAVAPTQAKPKAPATTGAMSADPGNPELKAPALEQKTLASLVRDIIQNIYDLSPKMEELGEKLLAAGDKEAAKFRQYRELALRTKGLVQVEVGTDGSAPEDYAVRMAGLIDKAEAGACSPGDLIFLKNYLEDLKAQYQSISEFANVTAEPTPTAPKPMPSDVGEPEPDGTTAKLTGLALPAAATEPTSPAQPTQTEPAQLTQPTTPTPPVTPPRPVTIGPMSADELRALQQAEQERNREADQMIKAIEDQEIARRLQSALDSKGLFGALWSYRSTRKGIEEKRGTILSDEEKQLIREFLQSPEARSEVARGLENTSRSAVRQEVYRLMTAYGFKLNESGKLEPPDKQGGLERFISRLRPLAGVFGGDKVSLFSQPSWFIIFIIVFSTVVGVITGVYPAKRAAKLNALEALRYK